VPDDPDFTPNPRRAIWIDGKFTEALLQRLRPQIFELTESREPITVFLNSDGAGPDVAEEILRLLRRTTQDGARASRIITVAAPKAASMAANFLAAGDWAIAYPHSTLLYHGARWPLSDLVAAGEAGRLYAQTLPTFHEINAAKLAQNSARRFRFIVSALRATFAQCRAEAGDARLTDLQCFQRLLRGKLSPAAQKVLDRAIPLWDSYNGLLLQFQKRLRRGRTLTRAHLQKLMLRASMSFEYQSNKGKPAWDAGLGQICDHFYFLNAYFDSATLCEWVAARPAERDRTPDADPEADYFLQFRLFFLALCRSLQDGENQITPADAVWLGLIDTVRPYALGANDETTSLGNSSSCAG